MEGFTQYIWLVPVGLLLGLFGTLVGAGGGFLLVPLLLLVYPRDAPEVITSISLAVVSVNATAGSISYARMGRIDYRAGVLFAIAAIPGAVLGAITTSAVPRQLFHVVLGVAIIAVGLSLLYRPGTARGQAIANHFPPSSDMTRDPGHRNDFNRSLGFWLSAGVGYLSSLLGIGGGIIHVPALVRFLQFPVHTATATSHFVLAVMAGSATITHIVGGAFHHGSRRAIMLGLGAAVGAPMGAALSRKLHGTWIIRALGGTLLLAGSRLLIWP